MAGWQGSSLFSVTACIICQLDPQDLAPLYCPLTLAEKHFYTKACHPAINPLKFFNFPTTVKSHA